MASTIIMPKQGLQMTEGHITRWLVREGDLVQEGEPLFEMETDKLTITIDASAGGTLLKILHPEGDCVPVTQPIAHVGTPGEPLPEDAPPVPTHLSAGKIRASPRARMLAEETGTDLQSVTGSGPDGFIIERDVLQARPTATPLARKVAAQAGIPLASVTGTGARGKVTASDVRAAAPAPAPDEDRRIPLAGMRKTIARRMKQSLDTMAQANHRMQVDMAASTQLRDQLKAAGIKVSFNDIVVRCAAKALTECPMMNASMGETEIVLHRRVNVGIAVATEDGLVVPVLRDADRRTLPQLAAQSKDLAARAKSGALTPDDLQGGTFTITNLGMYGVDSFTAIINTPEAGILAVGAIRNQPVAMPDDSVAVLPMLWLSLTYDHRIVDGAPAARFLKRIKDLLETPVLLL